MPILPSITGPRDLDRLTPQQLTQLAEEIRGFLVENVARTGGHLGPNLGVVELTIALHRTFSSPDDPIIFDTGHQSYVQTRELPEQHPRGIGSPDTQEGPDAEASGPSSGALYATQTSERSTYCRMPPLR